MDRNRTRTMSRRFKLRILWSVFAILTVLLLVTGVPLVTDRAPFGIVSFQLAGDLVHASAIRQSWDRSARESAYLNLYFDFPYLVTYSWLLSLICTAREERSRPQEAATGRFLSRSAWIAGAFDAAENVALLHQLEHGASASAAQFAAAAASVKFAILGIIVTFLAATRIKAALRS